MSVNAYDLSAEQALLGIVMLHPDKTAAALLSVEPDDWWHHRNRTLAAVITGMLHSGQAVDPTTVLGQLMAKGIVGQVDATILVTYVQQAWRPETAGDLAQRIRELSGRRKLAAAATRLVQRLDVDWEDDPGHARPETDLHTAINEIRLACEEAERVAEQRGLPTPQSMGDFLAQEDHYDWLVPGMLERAERIVLTGAEGGGKSVLCSQLAACLAGGVHPFTADPLGAGTHGVRVLVVDCENSAAQSRRRFRRVVSAVDNARRGHGLTTPDWGAQMFIEMRPAGIDLLSARDTSWLEHAISATAPDLLVLGPLYKLHHLNPSDETAARELVWVLDGLRERHGFALLTEAHAGNATDMSGMRQMRPIGSSLFRRWPEFGFGLQRAKNDAGEHRAKLVDVVSWRGSREERAWPEQLEWGSTLPWMPANPEYYDREARFAA